jgi:hypothetical protein
MKAIRQDDLVNSHVRWGPKGPRAFRSTIMEVSIQECAYIAKKLCFIAGPSGREVISLQKGDSSLLVLLNVMWELKRFLRHNAGGIWIKIHLNPKTRMQSDRKR